MHKNDRWLYYWQYCFGRRYIAICLPPLKCWDYYDGYRCVHYMDYWLILYYCLYQENTQVQGNALTFYPVADVWMCKMCPGVCFLVSCTYTFTGKCTQSYVFHHWLHQFQRKSQKGYLLKYCSVTAEAPTCYELQFQKSASKAVQK